MAYTYKINASENNTEIRFISLKDYDLTDSYEINGKSIDLLNVDGLKIEIGWVENVPVSITLNEDKTIGYVNINEINNSFNPYNIDFFKIQKELQLSNCTAVATYGDYIYTGLEDGTINKIDKNTNEVVGSLSIESESGYRNLYIDEKGKYMIAARMSPTYTPSIAGNPKDNDYNGVLIDISDFSILNNRFGLTGGGIDSIKMFYIEDILYYYVLQFDHASGSVSVYQVNSFENNSMDEIIAKGFGSYYNSDIVIDSELNIFVYLSYTYNQIYRLGVNNEETLIYDKSDEDPYGIINGVVLNSEYNILAINNDNQLIKIDRNNYNILYIKNLPISITHINDVFVDTFNNIYILNNSTFIILNPNGDLTCTYENIKNVYIDDNDYIYIIDNNSKLTIYSKPGIILYPENPDTQVEISNIYKNNDKYYVKI